MTTKNAILESIQLPVDLAADRSTLALNFRLSDGVQQAGPYKLTYELFKSLTIVTDEKDVLKIKDNPCRVEIEEASGKIIGYSHFLKDNWCPLAQPLPRTLP